MDNNEGKFTHWYTAWVLNRPIWTIAILILVVGLLGYQSRNFRIDASTETLLLENDKDLRYAREIYKRYGIQDFLLITFTPKSGELLDQVNLATIAGLRDSLSRLEAVESVLTILDVPLLESPPVSFKQLSQNEIPSLESPATDKNLAKTELSESHFYRDLLVSRDIKTTAIIVNLKTDSAYNKLITARNEFSDKQAQEQLSPTEAAEYARIVDEIRTQQVSLNTRATRKYPGGKSHYGCEP